MSKILYLLFLLAFLICLSSKESHKKEGQSNHFFRHLRNHQAKKWFGPFQLVSDVTYYLYLDTKNSSNATNGSEIVVNNKSSTNANTQIWYFHKLSDGNFSIYNRGAKAYLTLSSDKKKFGLAEYTGSDYQRFYVRSFWNGYTMNCQIDLGYYNYVTVSKNGTVISQYYNGNPKTQFFQLAGTAKLDLV